MPLRTDYAERDPLPAADVNEMATAVNTATTAVAAASAAVAVVTAQTFDPADAVYGAVRGTGVGSTQRTANTVAIQAAADDAAANDGILILKGVYEVDMDGLTFACHVAAESGSLNVSDVSGTALMVGSRTVSDEVMSKEMHLPKVIQTGKVGAGWGGLDVGIEFANLYHCHVFTQETAFFSLNWWFSSYGTGNAYNNYYLGQSSNGKVGAKLVPGDAGGWVNQNTFIGGRFNISSSEGTNIAGARHILIPTNSSHPSNSNIFIGASIEGDGPEYHLESGGPYNDFVNVRWEAAPAKVLFTGTSATDAGHSCAILYGYQAEQITFTTTGTGAFRNHIYTRDGVRIAGSGASRFQNVSSNAVAAVRIMAATADLSTADTAASVEIAANFLRGKVSTDTTYRTQLDFNAGRLTFGPGGAGAADTIIERKAANVLGMGTGDGWRLATTTTAGRPTAAAMGAGTAVYDTDLGKPIWSDGTNWRDASGTVV